jgi:hypothetical protein
LVLGRVVVLVRSLVLAMGQLLTLISANQIVHMFKEQGVGQVQEQAQLDRDERCWAEWVAGSTQAQIAERRGLTQGAISQAISRYLASRPTPEREAFRERTLERYEDLYLAHRVAAREWPRVAAIVRGILDSEARVLGLVQSQVHVDGEVQHVAQQDPGPTVEELMERWAAEGRIQGVLTRPGA